MTRADIAAHRLYNQRLAGPSGVAPVPFGTAKDAVRWFGAVQSQDYAGAKWALAQRMPPGTTDAALDNDFAEGAILRTHVLRPTWHFAAPEDLRWMLALTSPRVHAVNAHYDRKLELDAAVFERSSAVLADALRGGAHQTRTELAGVLEAAGITASGQRLAYLVMRAELDAVICSGPRRGKQFTYALLEERAPNAPALGRDEALAELAKRYFTSHGPALLTDFTWWSGLTLTDAKAGVEKAGADLTHAVIDGKTYWFAPSSRAAQSEGSAVHLLPNYDEFLVAYRDHAPSLPPDFSAEKAIPEGVLNAHILVVDGLVRGGWRRTLTKNEALIEVQLLAPLSAAERDGLRSAAERYGVFVGMPVALTVRP